MGSIRPRISKILVALLALASFSRADYIIDDQNTTSLVYSENPGGPNWATFSKGGPELLFFPLRNGTSLLVDPSYCFNYTFTYAPCSIANDCRIQIPFNGSGITIYVLQAGQLGFNASLTIDGGVPTYNVLAPPPGPYFYVPNVTLFSVQGMTTGGHTATLTVLNWDNVRSDPIFDYVLVNQTIVSPTTTGTSSVVSSTTPATSTTPTGVPTSMITSSTSHSSTNIGAVVGGVVGGLAVLAVLLLGILYFRRRCHEGHEASVKNDSEQRIDPFVSTEPPPQRPPEQCTGVTEHPTSESPEASPASPRRQKTQQSITSRRTSQTVGPSVTSSIQAGSPTTSSLSETPRHRIQQAHPALTDGQADLVTRLHANNVPAGAIARVIERMMAGEQEPEVVGFSSLPPPSYYYGTSNE